MRWNLSQSRAPLISALSARLVLELGLETMYRRGIGDNAS